MKYEFGFIGCGNMGGAIADAVAKSVDGSKLACADLDENKCARLKDAYGFNVTDAADIAENSRFIVLGVKPQMMKDTLDSIKKVIKARTDRFVLVSMAAGLTNARIAQFASCDSLSVFTELDPGEYPIIRIMPNTPVSVGKGVVLYCTNGRVENDELEAFKSAMKHAGVLDALPERLIDAASAVSGCGPAFVSMMIEAMADGGVECGLPRDKALLYAAETLAGTAKLLLESGKHPGKLKDEVCSPGGSTIVGVHELECGGMRAALMNAVCASYEKNAELGK